MSYMELHIFHKGQRLICSYDEDDHELVNQYNWHIADGHARSGSLLMHRLILGVTDTELQVDHIDHNKLNNQKSNLRICTRSQSLHNRVTQKTSSKFKGVRRYKGKYFAQIKHNYKYIYLGIFRSEITAAKVYDKASRGLYKEFGITNFSQANKEPLQLSLCFRDYITKRRSSLKLIERATREGWIKQLAFYHMLKCRFINSCIYSYRTRMNELAKEFQISTRTFYNYLKVLRSKDMIIDHSDNLKIKSIREFRTNRKKVILHIDDRHSIFDITCLLYCKLIEDKVRKQAFTESINRYERRKNGRGDRFDSVPCEIPFRPSLSYRTIAKLLKVSEYKAFVVVQNLIRLKVIKAEKQTPKLITKNFHVLESIEDYPGYRFNIGSNLFEQYGNRIEILQYPVYLQDITHKQYLMFQQHKRHINKHLQNS